MNPVATLHAAGSTELHASRTGSHCAQRLQPTRRFGYNALRLCTRQLHRARKQATETCAAAAVDAPSAADSSDSMDELSTKELYKRFDQLLSENKYKYKQGDRVRGFIYAVDQRGASVDIGAKMPAICPSEECSLAGVQRVCHRNSVLLVVLIALSFVLGLCSCAFLFCRPPRSSKQWRSETLLWCGMSGEVATSVCPCGKQRYLPLHVVQPIVWHQPHLICIHFNLSSKCFQIKYTPAA